MKICLSKQSVCWVVGITTTLIVSVLYIRRIQSVTSFPRLALINSTRIKNESEPFVRVREWFEKQCQHTQGDLTTKVQELQKTYEWLKIAPKDQKIRERHNGFRQEVAVLERVVQERKENLTQQFAAISSFLEDKLKQVISQLAKEKNVSIVLNQYVHDIQAILYVDDRIIDLTEDTIKHMNQETTNLHLPDVPTTLPNEQGESSPS